MPKKDTFYFPHDYNAANDVKCLFLRQQLGMEGYGIFWFLVEQLANSGGKLPLQIVPVLAMQMQVPEVKVTAVIKQFDLFEVDDEGLFFSNRLNSHLSEREHIRLINSEKGKLSALKRAASVQPQLNNGSTKERKGKEKKVKEIKEKENKKEADKNETPTIEDFLDFCKVDMPQNGLNFFEYEYSLRSKFNAWQENGWKDGYGKPIKNWKSKIRNTIPHLKPIPQKTPVSGNSYDQKIQEALSGYRRYEG